MHAFKASRDPSPLVSATLSFSRIAGILGIFKVPAAPAVRSNSMQHKMQTEPNNQVGSQQVPYSSHWVQQKRKRILKMDMDPTKQVGNQLCTR